MALEALRSYLRTRKDDLPPIAVHLLNAGVEVLTVRDWLGHRKIQNTLVYAQLLNPKRDAEISRAFRSKQTA